MPSSGRIARVPVPSGRGLRDRQPSTTRRDLVQEVEIELRIGEMVEIDGRIYTVIDIHNGEVSFRVDSVEYFDLPASEVRSAK